MADHPFFTLLEQDIPEAHQNLRDSHKNLENVAHYCRQNYLQAEDKRLALEETKGYATQALASVAYQINAFSYHLLQLFDHQESHISEMQGQVRHINQTVMVHKEKIARREIGALATTNKSMHRQVKILQPPNAERAIRYTRRPVDYSVFDDLGHGTKVSQPQQQQQHQLHGRNLRKSSSSVTDGTASISSATSGGPASNSNYDTTAIYRKGGTGTLTRNQGRNLGDYRTPVPPPPPVVPPMAPPTSQYGPGHMSNGRQIQTAASPRLGQQARGDHYRAGNMGGQSSLPGYPVANHHNHNLGSGPFTPPIYGQNGVAQRSPLPAPLHEQQQQYASRNEIFQYPPSTQPTRKLSNGSNGTSYGALSHNHGQHLNSANVPPPPPPPPPPPGPGDSYMRNGSASAAYPVGGNGVKTPIRNSTITSRMMTDAAASSVPPPPPPPPESTIISHHQHNGNGGYILHDGEPAWVPKSYTEKVVAIYDYQADKDDELSFMENQIIYVIKKNDDGWYEGVMEGVRGLFPGNYVESCI